MGPTRQWLRCALDSGKKVLTHWPHQAAIEYPGARAGMPVGPRGGESEVGQIGWFRPKRAQHPFSFIFSFSFLFSLIFESKFEFQICDELVLKFSEYMIWINHCGINLSIYKFYFCIA